MDNCLPFTLLGNPFLGHTWSSGSGWPYKIAYIVLLGQIIAFYLFIFASAKEHVFCSVYFVSGFLVLVFFMCIDIVIVIWITQFVTCPVGVGIAVCITYLSIFIGWLVHTVQALLSLSLRLGQLSRDILISLYLIYEATISVTNVSLTA